MKHIWQRIDAWLIRNAAPVASGLNPPASTKQLDDAEQFLGVTLPAEVCESYLLHNGQKFDSPGMMDGWELLSLQRICDEWKVWKDLLDGGDFAGIQSNGDGLLVRDDWWNSAWIPLTYSGSGDHHCLDLAPGPRGKSGQIIEMWHDDGARPVAAESFANWLSDFADELEANEFVLSDEYGGLMRRDSI
jgi:cell wall assembly regulator SMI1